MLKISVCIATHERSSLLQSVLTTLFDQTRPADEIVVSDSSAGAHSRAVVESFAANHPEQKVKWLHSMSRALPWQRWWAFQHTTGEVVLFLDDDLRLEPQALDLLDQAYRSLCLDGDPHTAGIGFFMRWEDDDQSVRHKNSFKERWLGTSRYRSGGVTSGGLTVSPAGLKADHLIEVDQLSGGAMSFRREVIDRVGLLNELVRLYDQGIGRTEDGVLSFCARQHGKLYYITQPVVWHPSITKLNGASHPYAVDGWRVGVSGTWGRAHTMRWLASSTAAYIQAWVRYALLEFARALFAVVRRPLQFSSWGRLAGACFGIARTVLFWPLISPRPKSSEESNARFSDPTWRT